MSLPEISFDGQYVRLAPLREEHAEGLFMAASFSRSTFGFTHVPDTRERMQVFVEKILADHNKGTALPFAIIEKSTGAIAGTTRFFNVEYWPWPSGHALQRGLDIPDAVEIGGTWLSERWQRTGINTETKLLLLTYAFESWKVQRVAIRTDARNERSRRNIERVGAKLDGILRSHMPASDGGIRDTASYSIIQSEWPTVKSALKMKLR